METQSHNQTTNSHQFHPDTQELDYWFKEFGISKEEILDEVKKGGSSTEAVEKFVKRTAFVA
jgi:hypothetical protein